MSDLQIRDLASAVGFAAIAYGLFNVLISFGSGRPVAEWINPHRSYLLSLAAVLLVTAAGLLQRGSQKHQTPPAAMLEALVRTEGAKPEAVGATSFALLAATLVGLYAYCRWFHPRDPRSFSPDAPDLRTEYRRAMRHYIRWSRQLDYAAMFSIEGERSEKSVHEALPEKEVFARMRRVDGMKVADGVDPASTVGEQLARWDALATRCFSQWPGLDTLVAPARQGENVLIFFDLQFGGVFVELIQEFSSDDGSKVRVFLFAVCLNQAGLDSASATRIYSLLGRAIRHIRSGGGKARG
ncbi:MAG: hypothetical protein K8U57_32355 [Planctomycetes bacterium]|nr:hypothetical protein [Planctomycetota bacterium]